MSTKHDNLTRLAGAAALALAAAAPLGGCQGERTNDPPRQFLPDMDDSPKFKPQTEAEFFVDGRAMRPRVEGTVAFGNSARADDPSRAGYARLEASLYDGIDHTVAPAAPAPGQPVEPTYLERIPGAALADFDRWMDERGTPVAASGEGRGLAVAAAMIERGRERFNIYCSACHGFKAEGGDPKAFTGGVVGRRWTYPVPSLQDAKYRDPAVKTGRDGYLFNVIRDGVPDANPDNPPKMPAYADKVNERDAWAIVAYVRTLQAAWQEPTAPAGTAPAGTGAPATPPSAAPGGQGTGSTTGAGSGGAGSTRETKP